MRHTLLLALVTMTGCGPLTYPMVERLPEEAQRTVDDMWKNMLTPPDRLDRELLLDVIVANQMHQLGVDRLQLTSEKDVNGGRVIISIRFDRLHSNLDECTVTYVDATGAEVRRERYAPDEVKERVESLWRASTQPAGEDESGKPPPDPAQLKQERRLERIAAATQPAR